MTKDQEINELEAEVHAMMEQHGKIQQAIRALSDTMDAHDWDGGDCDRRGGCDCIEFRMDDLKKFLPPENDDMI
jgi:hypothetical protein